MQPPPVAGGFASVFIRHTQGTYGCFNGCFLSRVRRTGKLGRRRQYATPRLGAGTGESGEPHTPRTRDWNDDGQPRPGLPADDRETRDGKKAAVQAVGCRRRRYARKRGGLTGSKLDTADGWMLSDEGWGWVLFWEEEGFGVKRVCD
nr:uncharacterized protein LOC112771098 [Arachis hypogaea]